MECAPVHGFDARRQASRWNDTDHAAKWEIRHHSGCRTSERRTATKRREKAQQLGGNAIVPPSDVPDVTRFATLQDPPGATFGILRFARWLLTQSTG
jgi:hypothetical protein